MCQELAEQHNLKIVAIAHPDEYVKADDDYADYYPWEAGPAEWVNLIAHASYVCTDSFHGSVFSKYFLRCPSSRSAATRIWVLSLRTHVLIHCCVSLETPIVFANRRILSMPQWQMKSLCVSTSTT